MCNQREREAGMWESTGSYFCLCPPPYLLDSPLMIRENVRGAINLSTGSYISLVLRYNSSEGGNIDCKGVDEEPNQQQAGPKIPQCTQESGHLQSMYSLASVLMQVVSKTKTFHI
jgi:hypothetical protein